MNVRTKLILSYGFVIVLCLALAAVVSTVLLRGYQRDATRQRLGDIAATAAPTFQANVNPATFDAAALLDQQAVQTQTRMILVSARPAGQGANRQPQGTVIHDTAGALPPGAAIDVPRRVIDDWRALNGQGQRGSGQPVGATPVPPVNARLALPEPYLGRVALTGGRRAEVAAIPIQAERRQPGFRVLLVTEREGAPARPFRQLARPLAWAAGVAFLASILVALALARSITRPLVALDAATRALARGEYSRRVPARGGDEIGSLGASFNRMAAEIERTRRRERDLLANISHDLKTPLTSIQGFAGALEDGACPPETAPAVGRIIHEEARRMGQLVGDVLHLSRLEAGDLPLTPAPIELDPFLRSNARRFEAAAREAGVALETQAPPRPVTFWGDAARLEGALGNLLENALRHTPRGGRIEIVGDETAHGGARAARIAVRDTGSGIAPDDLPRVFERFYQGDKSRAAGRAGSGLGLAIVKELVERHGGTVDAESAPGAGTTITLTLPLRPPTDGVAPQAAGPPPTGTATKTGEPAGRRRISTDRA